MYKQCKTEQSAARQRSLERELLQMMVIQRYEDISVSDLCQRMEIPRKSFYRYFASKDGALHGLLDHTLLEYFQHHRDELKKGERKLRKELEQFFKFWLQNRKLLDALRRSDLSGVLMERAIILAFAQDSGTNIGVAEEERQLRRQSITFVICGLMSTVLSWHSEGFAQSPAEMASVAEQLLTQPLLPVMKRFL